MSQKGIFSTANVKPNDKFGRLTIISIKNWKSCLAVCQCGTKREFKTSLVVSGKTRSCGCILKEFAHTYNRKHGEGGKTKEYRIWCHIKERCLNKKSPKYPTYGGRGITICKSWSDSYEEFLKDMGRSPKGMSIDRIDNDKGYDKFNCRWATDKQQARNKTNNVLTSEIVKLSRVLKYEHAWTTRKIGGFFQVPYEALRHAVTYGTWKDIGPFYERIEGKKYRLIEE